MHIIIIKLNSLISSKTQRKYTHKRKHKNLLDYWEVALAAVTCLGAVPPRLAGGGGPDSCYGSDFPCQVKKKRKLSKFSAFFVLFSILC